MAKNQNLTLDEWLQVYSNKEGDAPPSLQVTEDRLELLNAQKSGDINTINRLTVKYGGNPSPTPAQSQSQSQSQFPSLAMGGIGPSKTIISAPLLIAVALTAIAGYGYYKSKK